MVLVARVRAKIVTAMTIAAAQEERSQLRSSPPCTLLPIRRYHSNLIERRTISLKGFSQVMMIMHLFLDLLRITLQGVWEEYAPFNSWADAQAVWNPDTPILIAEWKAQKTVRGKGQWRDYIDGRGKLDSNVCNKAQVIQDNRQTLGFDSPSLQAPKCLFQHP
jgi:hypothetical protein